ncbi:MAG: hypothetical protein ABSH14_08055 [Verrucomicrobiia bacterium]|jgi:hypothetical protein
MKRFFRWLFSWRTARRALICVAVLATLAGLFRAEENWRGKHAWNKYRQELESRGEQLDFKAFIPKPIPDDQNFAATPLIKSWFTERTNYNARWNDSYSRAENIVKADKDHRGITDLVAWGRVFASTNANGKVESGPLDMASRAKAVPSTLEALKTNEAVFAALRAASLRPNSRYPVQYNLEDPWGILLPHLGNLRQVCRRLDLKACAELAAGQSGNALEDVKLMLYLTDSVKEEPFLISYLVRIACLQIAVQPIWEGLAEHRWSDAQLQELQTRLPPCDFVADLKQPLDSEQAAGILTVDLLLKGKYHIAQLANSVEPRVTINEVAFRVIPRGWYYQEQLTYCALHQEQVKGTFDATRKRVSPSQVALNAGELNRELSEGRLESVGAILHHHVMAGLLLPALQRITLKAAIAQTVSDQAALACALERYRLANGQFPETLGALVPRFISPMPHDVITGEPYKYRRMDDGQFVLYSVGWNEKDDGGVPGKTLFDEKEGDWVWQYPAR